MKYGKVKYQGKAAMDACPICDTPRGMPEDTVSSSNAPDIFYVHCPACGVFYQNPMPSEQALKTFYSSGEYRRVTHGVAGVTKAHVLSQEWRAHEVRLFLSSHLKEVFRHLDVGCGTGALLSEVEAFWGCLSFGLEIDKDFVAYAQARGLRASEEWPGGGFDLITAVHVLEHLSDPLRMLRQAWGSLYPGGHLYVEVPTSFEAVHTYRWDHDSLINFLCRAGAGVKVEEVEDMDKGKRGIHIRAFVAKEKP